MLVITLCQNQWYALISFAILDISQILPINNSYIRPKKEKKDNSYKIVKQVERTVF